MNRLLLVPAIGIIAAQTTGNPTRIRFTTAALSAAEETRTALPTPGITARAGVASPTRSPWIVANGWQFARHPDGRFRYELPPGKAVLAIAESFAYGADAILRIDPADEARADAMVTFLEGLARVDLPVIADLGVVEDGSALTGEVMNLLTRRNLLYEVIKAPSPRFALNIAVGSPEYPAVDAADPSAFAQKIRRQLTDERRALRIFGSEVVIGRLTGDARRIRLQLINYAGRDVEGLRIRLRGGFSNGVANVEGSGRVPLQDHVVVDDATEFSLPRLGVYAVIDLDRTR